MAERKEEERAALVAHAQIGVWTEEPGWMLFIDKTRNGFAFRFEKDGGQTRIYRMASFRADRIVAAIQAAMDEEEKCDPS